MSTFLYFAYGSNLGGRRLAARTPSAEFLAKGFVTGRCLRFEKVGRDGSAKCNCAPSLDVEDVVWGALYRIDERDRSALDRAEALGRGYAAETVTVQTAVGVHDALTYVATHVADNLQPFTWYLHHVVTGAHEVDLPLGYIELIRRIEAREDPDRERHEREMRIYEGLASSPLHR